MIFSRPLVRKRKASESGSREAELIQVQPFVGCAFQRTIVEVEAVNVDVGFHLCEVAC